MLQNKKNKLLVKLFSKNKSSLKNENCYHYQFRNNKDNSNSYNHNYQVQISRKQLEFQQFENCDNKSTCNANDSLNHRSNTGTKSSSALLAAKQACDEWGQHGRQSSTPSFIQTVSIPSVASVSASLSPRPSGKHHPRSKFINLRNSRTNHPSYKPPEVQRSHSMKERREAKEKAMKKYGGFSTSLSSIREIDELELFCSRL